ncbi:hypothetical protein [Streptomyces phytophilus]|uniref:hypothetical protein n=1 Tax=Streptomyces phytophilus TaxID=722715 RepID=UPI0015F0651C|nr:hypothetical protein [Streptomyces phytophilus]
MATTDWTRPFRLHLADGRTWHGAQFPPTETFPDGLIFVGHGESGPPGIIAVSLHSLFTGLNPNDPLVGARVEWPEPCPPS